MMPNNTSPSIVSITAGATTTVNDIIITVLNLLEQGLLLDTQLNHMNTKIKAD